jgi:hypothetical protein
MLAERPPPDAQPICTCLLLDNAPLLGGTGLHDQRRLDQLRPLNSRFNLDQSGMGIEIQHPVERSGIHMQGVRPELLGSHRMAPSGHRHTPPFSHRALNHSLDVLDRSSHGHLTNRGRIEPRMHVVEKDAGWLPPQLSTTPWHHRHGAG